MLLLRYNNNRKKFETNNRLGCFHLSIINRGIPIMFEPVSSRVSFPEIDASVLQLWKDKDVFARASEERMESPSFML